MGEFEDRMHGYSMDEAELKLQWLKPGGFFGERLFRGVFNAAQHYRTQRDSLIAQQRETAESKETEGTEKDELIEDLKSKNTSLGKALLDLIEQTHQIGGNDFLDGLLNLTVDGEPIEHLTELVDKIDSLNDAATEYETQLEDEGWIPRTKFVEN